MQELGTHFQSGRVFELQVNQQTFSQLELSKVGYEARR